MKTAREWAEEIVEAERECGFYVGADSIAAAITAARIEARTAALNEAAKVCDEREVMFDRITTGASLYATGREERMIHMGRLHEANHLAAAIRALARKDGGTDETAI